MTKQASPKKGPNRKSGLKKAPARLDKIIRLVKVPAAEFDWPENLPIGLIAPKDVIWPEDVDRMISSSLAQLPKQLRRHLRELSKYPDQWSGKLRNEGGHDPIYADLPLMVQLNNGWKALTVSNGYQAIRRWHEVLLKIARKEPVYMGFWLTRDELGLPVWNRDELGEVLDLPGVNFNYIRECKECLSIYYDARLTYKGKLIEPHCSIKCGTKIRQARSPRKKRPPSRLIEVKEAIKQWCKDHRSRQFIKSPKSVQWIVDYTELRPTTVNRCLEYLEAAKGSTK
jgi:hypothetical protein